MQSVSTRRGRAWKSAAYEGDPEQLAVGRTSRRDVESPPWICSSTSAQPRPHPRPSTNRTAFTTRGRPSAPRPSNSSGPASSPSTRPSKRQARSPRTRRCPFVLTRSSAS
ncbi:hypothetical protein ACFPRL_07280 [Pseudoclavibacter helvolus]